MPNQRGLSVEHSQRLQKNEEYLFGENTSGVRIVSNSLHYSDSYSQLRIAHYTNQIHNTQYVVKTVSFIFVMLLHQYIDY